MAEDSVQSKPRSLGNRIGFWLGIAAFFLILLFGNFDPDNVLVTRMAAIAVLMAVWWISDAIPLAATSLLPLVLFPLTGVMSGKEVAPVYVNYIIFLYLGGFMIALAMERWNLHKRIALSIIRLVGSRPSRLVLGFMLATAFLSMWISNTATTIMMLAIGLAVLKQAEESCGRKRTKNLAVALLLGIAYSASIGGVSTLVGTPPNLALVRIFELSFPKAAEAGYLISFGQFMMLGIPITITMLAVVWFVLTRVCFRSSNDLELAPEVIEAEYRKLGRIGYEEKIVLGVFVTTAILWIFRTELNFGGFTIPGWTSFLPFGSFIDDGTIAVAMALVLFFVPARHTDEQTTTHHSLLDAGVFKKVPWHIILLYGGGFALAKGFQTSGLTLWVGSGFQGLEGTPPAVLIGVISLTITFLTELTSNTATTEMILPLLASIATAAKIHPLLLMVPAALSASFAFMMPVATPPNAIVFSSNRISIGQMVKAGLIINLIGVVVVTVLFLTIGQSVFEIDPNALPEWAAEAAKAK